MDWNGFAWVLGSVLAAGGFLLFLVWSWRKMQEESHARLLNVLSQRTWDQAAVQKMNRRKQEGNQEGNQEGKKNA